MTNPPSRRLVAPMAWTCAALFVPFALAYLRSEDRWCSQCWTRMEVTELGFAVSYGDRTRVCRFESPVGAPASSVARFLPAGHVHDADAPEPGARQRGPYVFMETVGCGGSFPSAFVLTLAADPAFGDFLQTRIDAGALDIATVRALIAVPGLRNRDAWESDPANRALLRSGARAWAEYAGRGIQDDEFWDGFGMTPPGTK